MIKKLFPYLMTAIGLIFLIMQLGSRSGTVLALEVPSPTPTYDPLEEPVVPENPNEYELGRNWYWHYCMPCHGDKGQGLTDEWRAVWEPDHQDCWGMGCHAGERLEDSFAIPTIVPAIVSNRKLVRFDSVQALCDFLRTTHPPQNPGWLEEEQYRAIAFFLFSENDRPLVGQNPVPTTPPIPTATLQTEIILAEENSQQPNTIFCASLGIILVLGVMWGFRSRR